jgi:hypothetical protein
LLPWPKDLLVDYFDHEVSLKITLSWFVEPNPGAMGSKYPRAYRSFGLLFDLQRPGESFEKFKARVNATEPSDGDSNVRDDGNWVLGARHSRAGSLISDVWKGPVAKLLDREHICVYPQEGWWKTRTKDKRYEDEGRYCLIVSLAAPSLPVDIHAALKQAIEAEIAARIAIEASDD